MAGVSRFLTDKEHLLYTEEPEPVIMRGKHIDSEHAITLYEGEVAGSYGTGADMSHRMNHKQTESRETEFCNWHI